MKNATKYCFFLILFCISISNNLAAQNYLPDDFSDLKFGIALNEFKLIKENVSFPDDQLHFRIEGVEENPAKGIKEVTYYFDAEANQPLYEIIIDYKSAEKRDKVAKKLFGMPNYNKKEWRYIDNKGQTIWAWTYLNRLIIVAVLKGTEWEGEM